MSATVSRRDNTDRSLARSAWYSVPRKKPSRRVRYERAQLIPEVFLVEGFLNRRPPLHESDRTLRDGSFGMALSQALRARLRSHRPSGTFLNGLETLSSNCSGQIPLAVGLVIARAASRNSFSGAQATSCNPNL